MKKFASFSRIIKRKLRNERKMLISHLKDVGNQWREGFGGASSMLYVCSTFVFPSSSRWNRIMVTLCVGIDLESITNLGWNNKLYFSASWNISRLNKFEKWVHKMTPRWQNTKTKFISKSLLEDYISVGIIYGDTNFGHVSCFNQEEIKTLELPECCWQDIFQPTAEVKERSKLYVYIVLSAFLHEQVHAC